MCVCVSVEYTDWCVAAWMMNAFCCSIQGEPSYIFSLCINHTHTHTGIIFLFKNCTHALPNFSSCRPRTNCATSSTRRTFIPSPQQSSPRRRPGAKSPPTAGTRPPPPTLPPAPPPKVGHALESGHSEHCEGALMDAALWRGRLLELFHIGIDVNLLFTTRTRHFFCVLERA